MGRPKGFKCSAETRAKMSEARRRAWADPKVRAKMSEACRRALADPKVRAKMSEARRRAWAALHEAKLQPKRPRSNGTAALLADIPADALEAVLFGGRRR